jgi:excisionase family DNA binding protein
MVYKVNDSHSPNVLSRSPWYTIGEAAVFLGLSPTTIRRRVKKREIKYTKPGGKLMFHKSWLTAYMLGFPLKLTRRHKVAIADLDRHYED